MATKQLSDEVNKIIKNVFRRQHPLLAELIVNWSKIVGDKFSKSTHPIKVSKSREKGKPISILLIGAENSSISMEMSYRQDIILERMAVYFGYKAIHKVRIVVR